MMRGRRKGEGQVNRKRATGWAMVVAMAALAACTELPPPPPSSAANRGPCSGPVPDSACWPPGLYIYPPFTDPANTGPYVVRGIPLYPAVIIGGQH